MRHVLRRLGALLVAVGSLVLPSSPAAADHDADVHVHDPAPTGVISDPTPLLAFSADGEPSDLVDASFWITDPDGVTTYHPTRHARARTLLQIPADAALRRDGTYTVVAEIGTWSVPSPRLEWTFEYVRDATSWGQKGLTRGLASFDTEDEDPVLDLIGFPPPAGPTTVDGWVYVDDIRDTLDVDRSERGRLLGHLDVTEACSGASGPWTLTYADGELSGRWSWTPSCEASGTFLIDVTGATGRFAGMTGSGVWDVTGTEDVSGDWVVELRTTTT